MTVEQKNRRFNLQITMLCVGAVALGVNFLFTPSWSLYLNCALAGLQTYLLCETCAAPQPNPKDAAGRSLCAMTSTQHETPYAQKPREQWEETNRFLSEDSK